MFIYSFICVYESKVIIFKFLYDEIFIIEEISFYFFCKFNFDGNIFCGIKKGIFLINYFFLIFC